MLRSERQVLATYTGLGAAGLCFLAWTASGGGSRPLGASASDLVVLAVVGAASALCIRAARREEGRLSLAWGFFAAGCLSWTLGHAWAASAAVVPDQSVLTAGSDILWLAPAPLVVIGMLMVPGWPRLWSGRLRAVLDGLIVAGSLLLVSWEVVLGGIYRAIGTSPTTDFVSMAFPIGDVVVIATAVALVVRVGARDRVPALLVAAGLISHAVVNTADTYLGVHRSSTGSTWIDAGWLLAFLLIAVGANAHASAGPPTHVDEYKPALAGALLPYLAVAIAIVVPATRHDLAVDGFTVTVALVVAIFVIIRQALVVAENAALTKSLEMKVIDQYAELGSAGRRFASLVQHSSDVIAVVDRDARFHYYSPSVQRVLGYEARALRDLSVLDLVHPDDRENVEAILALLELDGGADNAIECRLLHSSGSWRHVQAVATNLLNDPSVSGVVLNIRDVTDRRLLEEQLRHRAFHDPLTGLANRTLFQERVDHALLRAERTNDRVVVLLLDLDGFKYVNDSLGHAVGDAVLIETARRIQNCVGQSDTVARIGGDEFAVLLERPRSDGSAVAERILCDLAQRIEMDGRRFVAQASIGIAGTFGTSRSDDLLRDADTAMYIAKGQGKGRYQVFEPSMHLAMRERLELEADLMRAIEHDELVVYYQPVYALRTGQLTAVEALVRWEHPNRGLVLPGQFIPLAEETSLIQPIGWWVVGQAVTQLRQWHDQFPRESPLAVSVNLSVRQLQQPNMYDTVVRALTTAGVPASSLLLELTETVLMEGDDTPSVETLRRLEALGVRLAIDDFGIGYSSLGRLRRLPVGKLKIDRSFVQEIDSATGHAPVVAAMIAMAHGLGLGVVAEGVETSDQLRLLGRLGCDEVQGYFVGRPMPAEGIAGLLAGAQALAVAG